MGHFRPKSRSSIGLLWRERPSNNLKLVPFTSVDNSFEVYIQENVLQLTLDASLSATPKEAIGLLAGRVCQDAYGSYTVVIAAEVAHNDEVEATASEIYISSNSYSQLRSRLETNHPILETIGWFHSHTTSPPIPSNEDLIEQSTWTDRNNVALIVSLVSERERFGLFLGPEAIPLFCRVSLPKLEQ